ncbi:MAG: hypothetical protein WBO08_06030 [Mycobacterium sp.]
MSTFDPDANAAMWTHMPADLRDTAVVAVEVVGPHQVRVTHRDGTTGVHTYAPEDFRGIFTPLRDPAVFATATVVDGDTLGWIIDGEILDQAPDGLYLHAHGACDGSCGRPLPS